LSARARPDLEVSAEWFRVDELGDSVFRISEPHVHELISSNSFLVLGRDRDLIIDSGLGIAPLRPVIDRYRSAAHPIIAVATHSHYDHVGSMPEFDQRLIHPAEASAMASAEDEGTLLSADFPESFRRICAKLGMPLPQVLITAAPRSGYDPAEYRLQPAEPTGLLEEGDTVDIGDRSFEVLHLPGHSPGGIALYERDSKILFSGDAVYDGPLLDEGIPGADIPAYCETMRRLAVLPVTAVHAGHNESFGQERLREITAAYLRSRDHS
jgi:glyoxylase-like metal-dependent hydrolase (beta-lactamase superfamily II)